MCKDSNAAINEAHILRSERDEEDECHHLEGPGCSREEEVAEQGSEQCAGLESVSTGKGGSGRLCGWHRGRNRTRQRLSESSPRAFPWRQNTSRGARSTKFKGTKRHAASGDRMTSLSVWAAYPTHSPADRKLKKFLKPLLYPLYVISEYFKV